MRIRIAADHAGLALKEQLIKKLRESRLDVPDFGPSTLIPEDHYPDYVVPPARSVANGGVERGVAICESRVAACVATNKVKEMHAALVHDIFFAHQGVEFYEKRTFSLDDFKDFMYQQSKSYPDMIELVRNLKSSYPLNVVAVSTKAALRH